MYGKYDLAIIGGGASGMAAAITAAGFGDRVLLLEKGPSLGKKIAASGNGRCNLMNNGELRYYGESEFASEVFKRITHEDLYQFWDHLGVLLSEEQEGRVYPITYHSSTVIDALKNALRMLHVEIKLQSNVSEVSFREDRYQILTASENFFSDRVLIATGGPASHKLGGSDSGYKILESFGHKMAPIHPALCPLCTDGKSISGLSGIRVRCGISLENQTGDIIFSDKGEALFTDYGISGICVMQCSRFIEDEGYKLHLDLTNGLFTDVSELMHLLSARRKQFSDSSPECLLNGILLARLSYAVLKQARVEVRNRKAGDLSDEELLAVSNTMRNYTIQVIGTRGLKDAQVTAGGALCNDFDPDTMESRLIPGLHASGEVLNIDGACGGYNLMFAFATGILAGMNGRVKNEKR